MGKLRREGIVRAIGTSNFGTAEMERLRRDEPAEPPATHQVRPGPSDVLASPRLASPSIKPPPRLTPRLASHQVKFNPYHPGRTGNAGGEDFLADCADEGTGHGCVLVAYCPLNAWPSKLAPIGDRWVAHVARRHGRTPAQVLLRCGAQAPVHLGAPQRHHLVRCRDRARVLRLGPALDEQHRRGGAARF